MTFRLLNTLALAALLSSTLFASSASAQSLPAHLRLAPELALALDATNSAPPPTFDERDYKELRRGRAMRAAGVGLIIAGLAALPLGFRKGEKCDYPGKDPSKFPTVAGAVVAGIGVSFTIAGSARVRRQSELKKTHAPSSSLSALALGAAISAFGTLGLVTAVDSMFDCSWSS